MRIHGCIAMISLIVVGPALMAQEPPIDEGPGDPELRRALYDYFERRLRSELALTDEQAAEVIPAVKKLEQERREAGRERRRLSRELRRAYREGAPDGELERLLDGLETVEARHRARIAELMDDIDRSLTVRQRIQFRTFLERFRQEIRRRVQELRGGGPTPGSRGGGPRGSADRRPRSRRP